MGPSATSDPYSVLTALIVRLRELYEVEVQGYEATTDGAVHVDVRLRLQPASPAQAPSS